MSPLPCPPTPTKPMTMRSLAAVRPSPPSAVAGITMGKALAAAKPFRNERRVTCCFAYCHECSSCGLLVPVVYTPHSVPRFRFQALTASSSPDARRRRLSLRTVTMPGAGLRPDFRRTAPPDCSACCWISAPPPQAQGCPSRQCRTGPGAGCAVRLTSAAVVSTHARKASAPAESRVAGKRPADRGVPFQAGGGFRFCRALQRRDVRRHHAGQERPADRAVRAPGSARPAARRSHGPRPGPRWTDRCR